MKSPKDIFKRSPAIVCLLWLILATPTWGQTGCIPEKPSVQTSVYDYAGIFSPEQKSALERKLIGYSDSTSTQIVVASTQDLCGGDIAMTATEWAHRWGIGQKDRDNGVFILVCPPDRKLFIATGYGVEGSLTDAMTRRIIETRILPRFRNGDYYGGVDEGVEAIFQVLTGQFRADKKTDETDLGALLALIPILLFIAVIVFLAVRSKNGGTGGSGSGNGGGGKTSETDALLTALLLGSMGRGGFSGGFGHSGGGGGFSGGFGGGGFGGGGAGGSW